MSPSPLAQPMEVSQQLTPNLYLTNRDVEIIDALVDNGAFFKDLSRSQVASFMQGEDFHLVLYFADDYDRGFTMYVVEHFSEHVDDLIFLSETFDSMLKRGFNYRIFGAAKSKVDHMVHMAPTFRAMFGHPDAQDPDM
jgi:hypothetical protein